MNTQMLYDEWLGRLDPKNPMMEELLAIRGNAAEINDRFYQEITFGTAGLRGISGAGTNRMNPRTVGRATQGFAEYILASGEDIGRGVAIAYDCRYHSQEYAELAAGILAAHGIRVYLFPSMRPTPELSFTIRNLGCVAGINMTASHNPPQYNGYKVYWQDGAQISGDIAKGIQSRILAHDLFDAFPALPLTEARAQGLLVILNAGDDAESIDMDRRYLDYVESQSMRQADELDLTVPIVYTPLNGAGSIPMRVVASERGFSNFHIVAEQQEPDPEFSTVGYPNPEDPKAFALAEALGRKVGAAILIATDPDSDRMAIEIPDGNGNYIPLNGCQTGALLIAYKAMTLTEQGSMPARPVMIQSIVTGNMGRAIAESYGIDVYEALTGFPNICGRIPELQEKGYTYFFAYEESIGCAPGVEVRDKDGIAAGMLLMEMAAYYARRGMTVLDVLNDLYARYGYYAERPVSIVREGQQGAAEIAVIVDRLRHSDHIEGLDVAERIDYMNGYQDIPAQNALKFVLTDGTWFALRPSGTEPKLKFYYYTVSKESREAGLARLAEVHELVMRAAQG